MLFVGPLIPLFWTSDDVSPGFQSQGGSLACMNFQNECTNPKCRDANLLFGQLHEKEIGSWGGLRPCRRPSVTLGSANAFV